MTAAAFRIPCAIVAPAPTNRGKLSSLAASAAETAALRAAYTLHFAFCMIPYSQFPVPRSLLPIAYCLLPIAYCLLPTAYCLLPSPYILIPPSTVSTWPVI